MADQRRTRPPSFAGSAARGRAAGGEPRRQASDFCRCGARRRQDLRDAAAGARPQEGRLRHRRRRRRDARPQGDRSAAGRARGHPAPPDRVSRPVAGGNGPRRDHRPPAADRPGRRARAHQRGRQPPSEALPRRRRAAAARHRRLFDGQHPAHREPERRRRPDHPCAGARDRAGFGVRPRRRGRAGRPHARRSDPAPQGGQGLRPQAGRAGAGATSSRLPI